MPSSPGENRSERAPMPSTELTKMERRLARAIQSGRTLTQLMRAFSLSETRVKELAKKHGLAITRGSGGNRL